MNDNLSAFKFTYLSQKDLYTFLYKLLEYKCKAKILVIESKEISLNITQQDSVFII